MTTQPQLERYLLDLDKALGPVAMSERAEIITEIKSHILEAEKRSPEKSMTKILEDLGSPEQVANRYLLERGLKTTPPPKARTWAPVVKWLSIGSLGLFSVSVAFLAFVIWKFSPVIQIDGEKETVSILGGLIQVDGKEGKLQVGTTTMRGDHQGQRYDGKKELKDPEKYSLLVSFTNAKIELNNSLGSDLSWSCKMSGMPTDLFKENKTQLTLDLSSVAGTKCSITLPKGMKIALKGANAKVEIEKPRYHIDVNVANGKVELLPDPNQSYNFDTQVTNGKTDHFESKDSPNSYKVAIHLANGVIQKD